MKRSERQSILPPTLVPRGLSREEAAGYIGVSPVKFDTLVADGRMPPPKQIDRRRIWDRLELDRAFAALPTPSAACNDYAESNTADIWDRASV